MAGHYGGLGLGYGGYGYGGVGLGYGGYGGYGHHPVGRAFSYGSKISHGSHGKYGYGGYGYGGLGLGGYGYLG